MHGTEGLLRSTRNVETSRLTKTIGIYFLVVAMLFYFLWLTEVIPAMLQDTIPKSLTDVGLPTNGVHVIDLAIILPAIFLTGVLLLKRKPLASALAPAVLTFFVLMDITIGFLTLLMKWKGLESNATLAVVMFTLSGFSALLLIRFLKTVT